MSPAAAVLRVVLRFLFWAALAAVPTLGYRLTIRLAAAAAGVGTDTMSVVDQCAAIAVNAPAMAAAAIILRDGFSGFASSCTGSVGDACLAPVAADGWKLRAKSPGLSAQWLSGSSCPDSDVADLRPTGRRLGPPAATYALAPCADGCSARIFNGSGWTSCLRHRRRHNVPGMGRSGVGGQPLTGELPPALWLTVQPGLLRLLPRLPESDELFSCNQLTGGGGPRVIMAHAGGGAVPLGREPRGESAPPGRGGGVGASAPMHGRAVNKCG